MNKIYKTFLGIVLLSLITIQSRAQLAGTYSVPATFSTIAAAINSLNIAGVNGTVTILVSAGYTETVPTGGYTLTATGTSTSPIIFQKNGAGANPLLIAYTGGTGTPASAVQDGVWRFIGSDYITINGIDINDPNLTNPSNMEFGYGFFKANGTNGCQNNTIKNCVITMNRENNAGGLPPAIDGSRGIDVVNALTSSHVSSITVTSASGANSNNTFHNNLIQNCNVAISIVGFADVLPYANADMNNDIGGLSAVTGNTLINFGGAVGAGSPAEAIYTCYQYSLNVSYNIVNNNNGSGVNHPVFLRGIVTNTADGAVTTINNNTVTLKGGGNVWSLVGVHNISGSVPNSNTISISNNLFTGFQYTTAVNANLYCIWNQGASSVLSVNNNTFTNNSTNSTSGGQLFAIANSGNALQMDFSNNLINLGTFNGNGTSATCIGINNGGGGLTSTLTVANNTVQNISYLIGGSGALYGLYNSVVQSSSTFSNNVFNNINNPSTGASYMIYDNTSANSLVTGNAIAGTLTRPNAGSTYGYYALNGATGTATITNNNFSNVTMLGGIYYGIYSVAFSTQTVAITNNTVSNISNLNTSINYGIYCAYTATLSNNIVSNMTNNGIIYGIFNTTNTGFANSVFSNTITALTSTNNVFGAYFNSALNTNVFKNKIYNLQTNGTNASANGIHFQSGTLYNVFNNTVGDLRAPASNSLTSANGIYISSGTTFNVYYNTVYLNTAGTGNFGSSAIFASTASQVNLRNNIFINNNIPNGTGLTVAYRRSSATLTSYSLTSNNNIFYAGLPTASNLIHHNGTLSYSTMALYQTAVGPTRDNASSTENTLFTSITGTNPAYLHVDPSAPSLAESGGVNITGITDDFDSDIRQGNVGYIGTGTAPDRGADEFNSNVSVCNLVGPALVTPSSTAKCDAQTTTLSASGYTTGNGITYQWQVSNTPGGPYANVVGGNGGNYPLLYTTSTLSPNTYYYVLLTTCAVSGQTAVSNEATVTIYPYPSLTVTPNTSTICMPGGSSVTLNASGANSYTWSPAAGLSGTVGVSVNALPFGTTVYTVTGANAGGCTSVTTTSINVLEAPAIVTVVATPTVVCSGGSSTLQVLGATTSSYTVNSITYSPIPTPSVGVTTLCNSGSVIVVPTNITFGPLDDVGWANNNIPFAFNFYGAGYSSFGISSNGFLYLGSGFPTVGGYGNAFPSPIASNPCIGALYGDLDFSAAGTINTFTTGVAPNRKVVVNWNSGKYYLGGGTGTITAQAILYETSNIIEVHTFQNTGEYAAVQGIQNAGGISSTVVNNRNSQLWVVASPDAYRFTPAGGTVSYSWTPSTFLTATNIPNPIANTVTTSVNYSISLSDLNGCVNSTTLQLNSDITPTVSITGSNSICTGNTLNLTGNGASTYSWSTGAITNTISQTPTVTTSYSVVGSSSLGCTGTAVKVVTVNITPSVTVAGPSTVCAGYSVNLIANGADSYSWSNGSTLSVIAPSPTMSINYTVVGTSSAGCASSIASKSVTVYALPTATITSPNRICKGEPVTIVASGTGVDTYSWNTGANTAAIVESPSVTTGYTVYLTNSFTGCSNTKTVSVTVDPCVGIDEISSSLTGLSVYPNPNSGAFTIELTNGEEKTIEICDVTGRIVLNNTVNVDKVNVDINDLANGIYYVKVISNDVSQIFKIVKQ